MTRKTASRDNNDAKETHGDMWASGAAAPRLNEKPETYLDDVEDNVLIEAVQDTLGNAVVIPGPVHQQQILQVFELFGREGARRHKAKISREQNSGRSLQLS